MGTGGSDDAGAPRQAWLECSHRRRSCRCDGRVDGCESGRRGGTRRPGDDDRALVPVRRKRSRLLRQAAAQAHTPALGRATAKARADPSGAAKLTDRHSNARRTAHRLRMAPGRTVVERVNARLKDELGARFMRVRVHHGAASRPSSPQPLNQPPPPRASRLPKWPPESN